MSPNGYSLGKRSTAELVATFMICFIAAGSTVANEWTKGIGWLSIAAASGLAVSAAVSATMNVSGAHLNPAVTLAMLATKRISFGDAVAYVLSQLAGATIAGFILLSLFNGLPDGDAAIRATGLGTPAPGQHIPAGVALVTEICLTFLLVFTIFGTVLDSRAPAVGGFGIGLAVAANILAGGPISGGSMNPARSFGPALAGGVWNAHWVYWAGPIIGALIAAFIYDNLILQAKSAK